MNEEEGRTPIYFVMGLGDQFSHRVSTDSDDGKRAIVGYLLTNSIPKKAEPIVSCPWPELSCLTGDSPEDS